MARLGFALGVALTALFVGTALLSLVWTPWPTDGVTIDMRLAAPSAAHPLGTDHLGRDMVSMLMAGAQTSLAVALLAVGLGLGLGVPLGLAAAASRGSLLDAAIMRANDVVFAFPALVIAVLITAALGPAGVNAVVAIGIFNTPVFARVARGAALGLWTLDYVRAARLAGKDAVHISIEHILPNIAPVLVIQASIQFALGILAEAGLAFMGLGAQPPQPSWGRMLAEAQTMAALAPRLALLPGLAITLTVLGLTLLGDGLRDRLDPRRLAQ